MSKLYFMIMREFLEISVFQLMRADCYSNMGTVGLTPGSWWFFCVKVCWNSAAYDLQ